MTRKNTFKQALFTHFLNSIPIKWAFLASLIFLFHAQFIRAQGVPRIGNHLEFAGITIHLTETTQHLVQQEAELLYVNRALVTSRLERMNLYLPIIKPLLAQHGLSDDFLFLALDESGSAATQAPLPFWAFNQLTHQSLRVDAHVDERLHPVRATLAAITRLKRLYGQQANWIAALHRYGQMPGSDTTGLTKKELMDGKTYALTDSRDALLIRLLASKIVLERALSVYHPQKQIALFPYEETRGKRLSQIASYCQVSEAAVSAYNSWLKATTVPENEDYTVYVPVSLEQYAELKQKTGRLEESPVVLGDAGFPVLRKDSANSQEQGNPFYWINGKKGIQARLFDNRITLAYRGKLKVRKFEQYNDLQGDRPVVPGEIYYLRKKSKRAAVPFHVVRRGQSLWAIAQQYGIQLRKLVNYNDINPEQQPAVARILWLQRKRPATVPIEYYRSPKQPGEPQPISNTEPVLAVTQPDWNANKSIGAEAGRLVNSGQPLVTPSKTTLTSLDSLIAALNKPDIPPFRSGATKMIQPARAAEPAVSEKKTAETPEEVSGPLIIHTVERMDTYATVARKYGVTVQELYVWNNLSAGKPLRVGQSLLIDRAMTPVKTGIVPLAARPGTVKPPIAKRAGAPWSKSTAVTSPVTKPVAAPTSAHSVTEIIHVVQAGENMYRIGLRYKVKPTQIQQWNNLPDLTAVVGARLVIRK
ncbi:LysM peptidoglycan-binding domain-containing protein [Larkinella insperata]|uniref:LysM peptidoglycan-binding domain-containing protein n=1 Tax=Larkinella insperata TaxID=332158 RepID=A0ABW3QES5_9BACT|nr:LysM peptidoglycan-binding domain-containing protein [Larkinella insperata]